MPNSIQTLVLASNNSGKLVELKHLLEPIGCTVLPQSEFNIPDADETGLSFIENAILKARHASKIANLPALADDSGLCVDALGGAPGIYSARYSGGGDSDNNAKLLRELDGVSDRRAQFICCLALVRHWQDPLPITVVGQWRGEILRDIQGSGGFGYDPLFWVEQTQCSSAELSKEHKSKISHRARAMQALLDELSREQNA
ncbi:RdgB/HAM1 family non-canonical purine NTP pyrophosphatase [Sessilibacter corallicola]|nr:RdgB/HAM1 family non-canonical purine NTP pyrophosphatase [Sessilibacter corallicola]MCE2027733.1 RdgB/HAM1 family non-canonical purine NTP pyrophosphatase [Sessilibacter corallicola]